ncbi:MAG TPA: 3-deoxy-7-phosphoheptulonate synthase [Planctomycetes bacterium]|nr:3-deoxy-7-phosphoheptulonate synthase [Planctomycetota bacterium]
MLIVMRKDASPEACQRVEEVIEALGFTPVTVPGPSRVAICVTGNEGPVPSAELERLPAVAEVIRVSRPYKLVSREVHPENSTVAVGDVVIGGEKPILIAGPCSVETESRTLEIAHAVKTRGASMFRAGAFKPRTSPYAFQGLGLEGLPTLARVREETGLPVVTEVVDTAHVEIVAEHVDMLQVGARNMQNYALLERLAVTPKPVLLKRGPAATLEEWLMAAEYLLSGGNSQVVLCERGIRTFADHARNTLDLNVVPLVREISHLPILVDPSHGTGDRKRVLPMSLAALACGAQGLLVETHTAPSTAYSDAAQTIDIATLGEIGAALPSIDLRGTDQ